MVSKVLTSVTVSNQNLVNRVNKEALSYNLFKNNICMLIRRLDRICRKP